MQTKMKKLDIIGTIFLVIFVVGIFMLMFGDGFLYSEYANQKCNK